LAVCTNDHYYDAARYMVCNVCGAQRRPGSAGGGYTGGYTNGFSGGFQSSTGFSYQSVQANSSEPPKCGICVLEATQWVALPCGHGPPGSGFPICEECFIVIADGDVLARVCPHCRRDLFTGQAQAQPRAQTPVQFGSIIPAPPPVNPTVVHAYVTPVAPPPRPPLRRMGGRTVRPRTPPEVPPRIRSRDHRDRARQGPRSGERYHLLAGRDVVVGGIRFDIPRTGNYLGHRDGSLTYDD
jgi:hypothetical protein